MNASYRNHGCRIGEYRLHDHRVLFLENELLRIGVLVDKGADIFQFLYKPNDTEFMLHRAQGVRPTAVQSVASGWGSFLDYYEGGWQEILPNGGPACTYKGIEFGLHGEITTIPWDYRIERDTPAEICVTLSIRPFRTPFLLQRTMRLRSGESVLHMEEALTNEGAESMEYMWGHHPAFGAPFLGPDCRVDLPPGDLQLETFDGGAGTRLRGGGRHSWPIVREENGATVDFSHPDAPGAGHEDLAYLVNLPDGWYAVTKPSAKVGFALTWTLQTFPYLWIWRQSNQAGGFPWYGQLYTMALEPWSSYPSAGLNTAIENGTAARLESGETERASLRAIVYSGLERVTYVSPTGEVQ